MFVHRLLSGPVRVLTVCCALAAASVGCPPGAEAQVPFEVIAASSLGAPRSPWTPTLEIIRSEAEFRALYRSLGRTLDPPEVNFRNHAVVAYFLGMRGSTGYRLVAERVVFRSGTMTGHLTESPPGPGCGVGFSATFPDIMIATIPWKGPVEVEVRPEARSCCP
jgi:hypothetical protein